MAETQYYHLLIYEGTTLIGALVNDNPEKIDTALHNHDTAIAALQALIPTPGSGDTAKFLRGDHTWQNIPLPGQATASALGTLKIGYSESGKYYALKLDANGKGYVYVPWENTTYPDATTSAHGLMTAADKTKLNGIAAGAQVNPGVATTSANGLMSASDKSKLNGIAAGAQVNPGAATQSAAGLMSAADKKKLDGIATGAQVNPGVATTSSNGLMSSSDKSKLNGIAAGAQVNPGNFSTSAAGLTPASGNANNVLKGNGWGTLQSIIDATQALGFCNINGWYGKLHLRYVWLTNKESNKDYHLNFADCGGVFPNNCLWVGACMGSKFQASDRVTVFDWDKNGCDYNCLTNNGSNYSLGIMAFGY